MTLRFNHKILIVDDEESVTNSMLRLFRREHYMINTATSGLEGLKQIREAEKPFSLIISDQQMPEMTGVQFLAEARKIFPDTMRILLTGHSDIDAIIGAINNGGIHRYLTKPWNDENMLCDVRQILEQYELVLDNRRLLELTKRQSKVLLSLNKNLEERVREKTGEIIKGEKVLQESFLKLQEAFASAIEAISTIVEVKDTYTYGHQQNVAKIACNISEEMKLTEDQQCAIRMSAIVHDIGKIAIPAEILNKPGRLSEMEMGMIRTHPEIGSRILEKIAFPYPVARIVFQHHERINGSGYPLGISNNDILLEARILGVADVVDAIASHRPYRPALGLKEALKELTKNKGILYDPEVVNACIVLFIKRDYGLVKE
ncbi:MAG TPA: HD domain-containing phosphohydrolase [Syntrophales bacterium]|nr:HD domain-containing phosphohydrolase [Syntrophales bacterium]